jgi:HEPN domain-containing protein
MVAAAMASFERDEKHWLFKLSPDEWIRAGQSDLKHAEQAYAANNPRAGLAGAKRAAGMALNGALIVEPDELWGRSYVDHLMALGRDAKVPQRVREACRELTEAASGQGMPGAQKLVTLRTSSQEHRILEAARDVIAHAYAVVKRHEGKE